MKRRWVCGTCGRGEFGPSKPPADATVRFCLKCSQKTGRMVRRTCPALERARTAKVQRQRATVQRRRVRKTARRQAVAVETKALRAAGVVTGPWSVCGLDVLELARRCWRVLCARGRAGELPQRVGHLQIVPSPLPTIQLRRRGPGLQTRGRAYYRSRRVILSIGEDCDRAKLCELVLHELTHIALGAGFAHGPVFNGALAEAALALWKMEIPRGPRGYGPSRYLERVLRAKMGSAAPELAAPPAPAGPTP